MKSPADLFSKLDAERSATLRRAMDCSALTIPALIPESSSSTGKNIWGKLRTTYQGVGARGVNNLAARLLLTLLPPTAQFFRLVVDDYKIKKEMQQQGGQDFLTEVDHQLSEIERAVVRSLDKTNDRSQLFEALKHLLVGGNCLIYLGEKGIRFYPLAAYCVDRDPNGNPLSLIIREEVSEEYAESLGLPSDSGNEGDEGSANTKMLYTVIEWDYDDDLVRWSQFIEDKEIPDSKGISRIEICPWLPLRFYAVAGDSYGRSYVDELMGDLLSLEALSQALVEGSAMAARIIYLVSPNGVTSAANLARANNGDFVPGNVDDVHALQGEKSVDLNVAAARAQALEQRLSLQFLLNSSAIRNSERTTAEEVRLTAQELEAGLGGIYSQLALEFQAPLIRRRLHDMTSAGKIPPLPDGLVSVAITTGVDAIGRGQDAITMGQFLGGIAQMLGPQAVQQYVNISTAITRYATALGIDSYGLVKTQQELAAEQAAAAQAMQQQTMAQSPMADPSTMASANKLNAEAEQIRNGAGA